MIIFSSILKVPARLIVILLGATLLTSCAGTKPAPSVPNDLAAIGLCQPETNLQLQSIVTPPLGWKPDPIKLTDKHRHQVWLSPTGDSAYGVIYFDLPLPVGNELTLSGFLRQMKATEGEATLISKTDDDTLPGIRFVAAGGLYKIRCNLMVHGFHGWAIYAGSLRSRADNPAEIKQAEIAREHTRIIQ